MSAGSILAFDLARKMGWAEGVPGEKPEYGTHSLAPDGSEPMAVFGGMIDFLGRRLQSKRYQMVIYEAPLDPRHMGRKTNLATARMLLGLPAVVEGVAYQMGMFNLREASVDDVRRTVLGIRPKKAEAKIEVMRHLRFLGYEPQDDNAGDALALWLYAASIVDNRIGAKTTRLFAQS